MSRPSTPLKIDTYQAFEVLAAARTGQRELGKIREMIAGEIPWGPQVRLLVELHRRGHFNINDLVQAEPSAAPEAR